MRLLISGKTLEVKSAVKITNRDRILNLRADFEFYFVSGFFVLAWAPIENTERLEGSEGEEEEERWSHLTLTNPNFEILHQETQAKLHYSEPIGLISSSKIVSRGAAQNDIYLHQVDKLTPMLILIKKVTLGGWVIKEGIDWLINPY